MTKMKCPYRINEITSPLCDGACETIQTFPDCCGETCPFYGNRTVNGIYKVESCLRADSESGKETTL